MIHIDEGPYLERVGKFVREIRESKNLTQGQLADILGVSQSALSAMERGETKVDVFKVRAIAALIKIKVSDFFKCLEGREAFEQAERTGGNWTEDEGKPPGDEPDGLWKGEQGDLF
jgi:transcriptional regulator with XRE-family HTH domain